MKGGRPVPRLALLFFGAAKDVPEAAETVTAGTASYFILKRESGPLARTCHLT